MLEVTLDDDNPAALIERHVRKFWHQKLRACDKYNKAIRPIECYHVAVMPQNQNTLYLIPEADLQRMKDLETQALVPFRSPDVI
jgi:hypothetical protein